VNSDIMQILMIYYSVSSKIEIYSQVVYIHL